MSERMCMQSFVALRCVLREVSGIFRELISTTTTTTRTTRVAFGNLPSGSKNVVFSDFHSCTRWKNKKNQIDYILMDNRYKNGVTNSKSRPGADCGTDHNPVIACLKVRLRRIIRKRQNGANRWNPDSLRTKTSHSRSKIYRK